MPDDFVFLTKAAPEVEAYTGGPAPGTLYNSLKRAAYSGRFNAVKIRGALAFPRTELPKVVAALGLRPMAEQPAAAFTPPA